MESIKKWLAQRHEKNGIHDRCSPPKLLGTVSSIELRQWARTGAENKLERAVLAGQGRRLLAEAEALPLSRYIYSLIHKCTALHAAVEKGSLLEMQELLERDYNRHKYVACWDEAGAGLLHKAVYYNYLDIAEYLVNTYPQLVHLKDSEGRTALHYTAACREEAAAAALLQRAGAARGARDAAGRTLAHYRAARTSLALPALPTAADMPQPKTLVVKRHNIRIWCHECDMGRLQRVVWEGQGSRLLSEVSSQPVVKRFLEAVPYIMNTIREIHSSVINNDLEGVIKLSSDPVPPQILSSRDTTNMTVLHKAAGLGHNGILKYIIERYPQGINDIDNDGRTPLHYAAGVRDDQHTYKILVDSGADESIVDNKNKTPGYYINRPTEIDKNIFKHLPEAPRTPSSAYPSAWDWKILSNDFIADFNKRLRKKHLKTSHENISFKSNTNTISETIHTNNNEMKNSNTCDLINSLPDLNEPNIKDKPNMSNGSNGFEPTEMKQDYEEDNDNVNKEETPVSNENLNEKEDDTCLEKIEDPLIEGDEQVKQSTDNSMEEKHDNTDNTNKNIDANDICVVQNTNEKEGDTEVSEPCDDLDFDKTDINQDNDTQKIVTDVYDENKEIEMNLESYNDEKEKDILHEDDIDLPNNPDDHESNQLKSNDLDNDDMNSSIKNEIKIESEQINVLNADGEEEETNSSIDEGNDINHRNEDDDDVQVQGNSNLDYPNIIDSKASPGKNNSSATRGNIDTTPGNLIKGHDLHDNLIEGVISNEAEQETLDASILRGSVTEDILIVDNEIDPEVTNLINTANMEMLATLVLNGEGSRLIGRHSGNLELQAFLDNVPAYMQKINRVHVAARDGSLKDLQAALDRRKFAIARDPISPNGATPLHVATIFGKTNIVKYLGGRFPETLSAVDFEGRTALHYAAILPDNGHYYNLLQQLGANSKDLDDNGKSAEDFYKDPTFLSIDQLYADFGISEEIAKNMFADKGVTYPANGHIDTPVFHTEEGRYLAKSLGDPLIKGLTEVANIKPKDPVAFLATFLHNFPEQDKFQLGTQESNVLLMQGNAEVENDQPPPEIHETNNEMVSDVMTNGRVRSATRTATRPRRPIDVITVEPQAENSPEGHEIAFSSANRDEHGQSMLHFAAARAHSNNALLQLLQESDVSLAYRDELYRTARDISIQANVLDNTVQIDKYVLQLAARGNTDKIMELLLLGYNHILNIVDDEGMPITDVISQRGDGEMNNLLSSIPNFEESRESLHRAIRMGDLNVVKQILSKDNGRTLARAHNTLGRCALHTAVLAQKEDIVDYLAETFPELLRTGDNLERSPLHYAMGVEKMEALSHILIRAGAKRVLKDLKGRQPSYYFMNKSDILRLKEEEEAY